MTINMVHKIGAKCVTKSHLLLIVLFLLATSLSAQAQILWYNGDNNFNSGLVDTDSTASVGAYGIVYENFDVTSVGGWNISSVYGNFLYSTVAKGGEDAITPTANWEIRTGMSDGNGGTLVASGVSPLTVVQTGTDRGYTLDTATISGLNVTLGAGTYWLAIQPVATAGYGYLVTTSGTNSIGFPAGNDGNAFYTNPAYSYTFNSTAPSGAYDFSMGIIGLVVPEPGTWLLLLVGVVSLALFRLRRVR